MECSNVLKAALNQGDLPGQLYRGSPKKDLVTDLQRVLVELGFKQELKFDNYEADGDTGRLPLPR